jgi:hypothetical protein
MSPLFFILGLLLLLRGGLPLVNAKCCRQDIGLACGDNSDSTPCWLVLCLVAQIGDQLCPKFNVYRSED